MTTYKFALITPAEANSFSVEVDFLEFDVPATAILVADAGGGAQVTVGSRVVSFPFSMERLAFDNFTFPDGSQLLVGDADIQNTADSGPNFINGTAAGDLVYGRAGNDTINGQGGSDKIAGNQGDDVILNSGGFDTVFGGQGNDRIDYADAPGEDALAIAGNFGNDTITGGGGADLIFGGQDDDLISGENGRDTIAGGLGNDTLLGNAGADSISGNEGDDTVFGGSGSDILSGNGGNDRFIHRSIDGPADRDTIFGGQGADIVDYTQAGFGVVFYGNRGGDGFRGGTGGDTVYGGQEGDFLETFAGDDIVYAGTGDDFVNPGSGRDTVYGGTGNDVIDVRINSTSGQLIEGGADIVYGEAGDDAIRYNGADGTHTLFGGLGNDEVTGGSGNDLLYGNEGNDYIQTGSGSDTAYGGEGRDTIVAQGSGSGLLYGGLEGDRIDLINGRVQDRVVIRPGDTGYVRSAEFNTAVSDDIIAFETGVDKLVTGVPGRSSNYVEATAATHADAQNFAESAIANGAVYAFVVARNPAGGLSGFLFWDKDSDRQVDSEVRLLINDELSKFDFGDII